MKVTWSETSEETLNLIIDYIENDFGVLVAENYFRKVLETVADISTNPELFPVYQKNKIVRKAVINKKTILYYSVCDDEIVLVAFYDVRLNNHKI